MAAAIPAAIGLGGSVIGGIQGKGAQKAKDREQQQFMQMLQPFLQSQSDLSSMSLDSISRNLNPLLAAFQGGNMDANQIGDNLISQYGPLMGDAIGRENQLYGQGQEMMGAGANLFQSSLPYLGGAASGLKDVQNFYRPFMQDGARAIERFLPSANQTNKMLAPEFSNINQGFQSASNNIAKFSPKGTRAGTTNDLEIQRQRDLSNAFFTGRNNIGNQALNAGFQGAAGQNQASNSLAQLFQAGTGAGINAAGQGLNTIGAGANYLTQRGGLAQNSVNTGLNAKNLGLNNLQGLSGMLQSLLQVPGQGANSVGNLFNASANRNTTSQAQGNSNANGMGKYLVDLFQSSPVQGGLNSLFKGFGGGGGGGGMSLKDFGMD